MSALEKDNYLLCIFGKCNEDQIASIGIEYRLFGNINNDDVMRQLYNSADVFVAPSVQEAFGKTLAEAMACKVPVVCFDTAGPSSIVSHMKNGFKARSFDAAELAKGIEWVCIDSDYETLSENAREFADAHFNNRVVAKRY